jgi:hypothetical protein
VRNFQFLNKNNRDISSDIDSLTEATTVSITFEFQKRDIRNDIISHQKSGDKLGSGEMCPVRTAAEVIKRLYSYNIPKEKFRDKHRLRNRQRKSNTNNQQNPSL